MLRTTAITKELAVIERKLQETTNQTLKDALKKKQARLKDELNDYKKSTPALAKQLLAQRTKIKQLSKVDFNDLIRRLSKKPEYSFLRTMSKSTIKTDIERPAKPVGWRFKGRGNYDKPTLAEIKKGKRNGTVYREVRPLRSDVSQPLRLEEGGGIERKKPLNYKHIVNLIKGADNPKNQQIFYSSYSNSIQISSGMKGAPQSQLKGSNLVNFFKQPVGSSSEILELFKEAAKNPEKTKTKIESLTQGKIYVDINELGWGNEVIVKYKPRYFGDKMSHGGTIEIGDKVKASKEYGGKSGTVIDKRGSFVVVKYTNGESDSYHESDLVKKMETGGGIESKKKITLQLDSLTDSTYFNSSYGTFRYGYNDVDVVVNMVNKEYGYAKMKGKFAVIHVEGEWIEGRALNKLIFNTKEEAVNYIKDKLTDEDNKFGKGGNMKNTHMMEDGGVIGQEIVFDDNGETNKGVIKDIHEITGNYIVTTNDGRTVLADKELDVISLGKMRKQEAKKSFSLFEDGGGVHGDAYRTVFTDEDGTEYRYFKDKQEALRDYDDVAGLDAKVAIQELIRGEYVTIEDNSEARKLTNPEYIELSDGQTTVSVEKYDGKWYEGNVISGKEPYGWGGKTYMGYLKPEDIASYLSMDYNSSFKVVDVYKDGGNIEKENNEMLHSQAKEAKHHIEELHNILTSKTKVEPWVVAKMTRAKTDLSDITHYLDGNTSKMAKGGKLTDAQQEKFDKVMHEWKQGKLHSGSANGPIVKDQNQAIAIAYSEAYGINKMLFGGMVNELSDSAIDRMEGLVPISTLKELLDNAKYIIVDMENEGFEKDEVMSFLAYKISQIGQSSQIKPNSKDNLLKLIGNKDDAEIIVYGKVYTIYNPNNGNDDNAAMWGKDTIKAIDENGDEYKFKYSEIDEFRSNVEQVQQWTEEDEDALDGWISDIQYGFGWITPGYVEDSWTGRPGSGTKEWNSDIQERVYQRLIDENMLFAENPNDSLKKGKKIKDVTTAIWTASEENGYEHGGKMATGGDIEKFVVGEKYFYTDKENRVTVVVQIKSIDKTNNMLEVIALTNSKNGIYFKGSRFFITKKDFNNVKEYVQLATGGAIKGSNSSTGEKYGVVVGSKKHSDEYINNGTEVNVRKSYGSRISEVKLIFDADNNLYEVIDYGSSIDGYPNTSRGSGTKYNADKKETKKLLSQMYNASFATKLLDDISTKMATGGGVDSLKKGDKITLLGDEYVFVKLEKDNSQGYEEERILLKSSDGDIKSYPKDMVEAYSKYATGGGVDGMSTVNEIARLSGLRAVAIAEWGDKNNINLNTILKDLKANKIKGMDLMTAIVGKPGNKYSKDLIAKYSKMANGGKMSGWKHKMNC